MARKLPFPVFDADNHMYETPDAFTMATDFGCLKMTWGTSCISPDGGREAQISAVQSADCGALDRTVILGADRR